MYLTPFAKKISEAGFGLKLRHTSLTNQVWNNHINKLQGGVVHNSRDSRLSDIVLRTERMLSYVDLACADLGAGRQSTIQHSGFGACTFQPSHSLMCSHEPPTMMCFCYACIASQLTCPRAEMALSCWTLVAAYRFRVRLLFRSSVLS